MSGQLLRAQAKDAVVKHTHVVLTFTQGGQLRYVDPRTFGELFVTAPDELTKEVPELADLGFDPVDEPISWVEFARALAQQDDEVEAVADGPDRSSPVSATSTATRSSGRPGLRHDRVAADAVDEEIRRLYRAIVEVLHEAVKHRGSSLADQQYVDLHGRPASYQLLHQAYDREGQACRRCRTPIVREKAGSRSTYYCPNCQI